MTIDTTSYKKETDSIRQIQVQKADTTIVPIGQNPTKNITPDEINNEIDTIVSYNKKKLEGLKDTLENGSWAKKNVLKAWFKLLGIPTQTISEADKLCADKNFSTALKNFTAEKHFSNMSEFLGNETNQKQITTLLKNYTENNDYPNIRKLLDKNIVQKEVKSYLKQLSENYKK